MKEVTVNKTDLLTIVQKNRDEHRSIFEQAQAVYREKVIGELDRMLIEAKRGDRIRRVFSLPEPEDHTDDYDRAIGMLQMSVEDTVTLSGAEYAMYVQNEWGWQRSFAQNTEFYVSN